MSNERFPSFPGLAWSVFKTPTFSNLKHRAASGRETRLLLQQTPLWEFTLDYEVLREAAIDGSGFSELRHLMGFFLQRHGSFESFLYQDPSDYIVQQEALGIGDAVASTFQLRRSLGGFDEIIRNPLLISTIYVDGSPLSQFSASGWYGGMENRLLQSEQLSVSPWSAQFGCAITPDSVAAPDGTTTADLVTSGNQTGSAVAQDFIASEACPLTLSFFVRAGTASSAAFGIFDPARALWLPVTAAILSGPGSIVAASPSSISGLTSSWTRLSLTTGAVVTGRSYPVYFYPKETGPNTLTNYAWGFQMERGIGVSGYLKTTSVVQQPDGLITLRSIPAATKIVAADFSYAFRVRFKQDVQEFEEFMHQLWEARRVQLVSIKP